MVVSRFTSLRDNDKGGRFNRTPFARQAEPPVEPFGDGVISTGPIPSGNLSLTAKTERKRNVRRFTSLHDDANQRRVLRRWFAQPFSHAHHKRLFAAPILLQCYMLHVTIRWFHIAQDGLIENI